jgi:hypothetical protein
MNRSPGDSQGPDVRLRALLLRHAFEVLTGDTDKAKALAAAVETPSVDPAFP